MKKLLLKALNIALALTFSFAVTNAQSWITRQSYPLGAGADGGICFSIGNKIYAGGGMDSKSFYEYNPGANTWTAKANIPGVSGSRAFAISFAINGKGYVALGIDGTTTKNDLWQYDTTTNSWTQKANFPGSARDGLFCFVINNIAYCGAGEDPFSAQQYNKCYSYNPATDIWDTIATLPRAGLIYPFSFVINNKGYFACGADTTEIKSTYEYNPITNSWAQKADFTGAARQAGVSFVLSNIAYCGLGMSAGFFNDFYSYNPISNTWQPSIALPGAARSFPVAVTAGNAAYAGLGWSFTSGTNLYLDWYKFSFPTAVEGPAKQDRLAVVPNPATKQITITSNDKLQTVSISDLSGKAVISMQDISDNKLSINTANLPAGTYILKTIADGKAQSQAIQIIH